MIMGGPLAETKSENRENLGINEMLGKLKENIAFVSSCPYYNSSQKDTLIKNLTTIEMNLQSKDRKNVLAARKAFEIYDLVLLRYKGAIAVYENSKEIETAANKLNTPKKSTISEKIKWVRDELRLLGTITAQYLTDLSPKSYARYMKECGEREAIILELTNYAGIMLDWTLAYEKAVKEAEPKLKLLRDKLSTLTRFTKDEDKLEALKGMISVIDNLRKQINVYDPTQQIKTRETTVIKDGKRGVKQEQYVDTSTEEAKNLGTAIALTDKGGERLLSVAYGLVWSEVVPNKTWWESITDSLPFKKAAVAGREFETSAARERFLGKMSMLELDILISGAQAEAHRTRGNIKNIQIAEMKAVPKVVYKPHLISGANVPIGTTYELVPVMKNGKPVLVSLFEEDTVKTLEQQWKEVSKLLASAKQARTYGEKIEFLKQAQKASSAANEEFARVYSSAYQDHMVETQWKVMPTSKKVYDWTNRHKWLLMDGAVLATGIGAEFFSGGTATPAVVYGTSTYWAFRGGMTMYQDYKSNKTLTWDSVTGLAMMIPGFGGIAGKALKPLAAAGKYTRLATGVKLATGTAGAYLVGTGTYHVGKAVAQAHRTQWTGDSAREIIGGGIFLGLGIGGVRAIKGAQWSSQAFYKLARAGISRTGRAIKSIPRLVEAELAKGREMVTVRGIDGKLHTMQRREMGSVEIPPIASRAVGSLANGIGRLGRGIANKARAAQIRVLKEPELLLGDATKGAKNASTKRTRTEIIPMRTKIKYILKFIRWIEREGNQNRQRRLIDIAIKLLGEGKQRDEIIASIERNQSLWSSRKLTVWKMIKEKLNDRYPYHFGKFIAAMLLLFFIINFYKKTNQDKKTNDEERELNPPTNQPRQKDMQINNQEFLELFNKLRPREKNADSAIVAWVKQMFPLEALNCDTKTASKEYQKGLDVLLKLREDGKMDDIKIQNQIKYLPPDKIYNQDSEYSMYDIISGMAVPSNRNDEYFSSMKKIIDDLYKKESIGDLVAIANYLNTLPFDFIRYSEEIAKAGEIIETDCYLHLHDAYELLGYIRKKLDDSLYDKTNPYIQLKDPKTFVKILSGLSPLLQKNILEENMQKDIYNLLYSYSVTHRGYEKYIPRHIDNLFDSLPPNLKGIFLSCRVHVDNTYTFTEDALKSLAEHTEHPELAKMYKRILQEFQELAGQ